MNAQAGGESPAAAAAEAGSPGELLRRERERRQLSVRQAAEDLHLDVVTIEAIEANRFQALAAPVYAKGHLRKYATLLGLSPEFIIQRYEALSDTPEVPTPVPATVTAPQPRQRRSLKPPRWLWMAVIGSLIAWAAFELLAGGWL
jgi:cytoskeleton protein RodZ